MNLIAWNLRGCRGNGKTSAIKKLIQVNHPIVLGLVETKHLDVDVRYVGRWWGKSDIELIDSLQWIDRED